MSADFLFSFLLFFQVQIESIKESGFYKMLSEKYPEVAKDISDPQANGQRGPRNHRGYRTQF